MSERMLSALNDRIATLDRLIGQEAARHWTIEGVLRADRSLLFEILMELQAAPKQDGEASTAAKGKAI
jgi:hypothetical protein